MKNYDDIVELYDPGIDEYIHAVRQLIRYQKCLRMWKEGEQWFIWCDQCQRCEPIDKHTRQMVIDSHVCPMCFREAEKLKYQSEEEQHALLNIEGIFGYWVSWAIQKGKIEKLKCEQVAYWTETTEYVKNIIRTMNGCIGRYYDDRWRKVKQYYGYWKYHGAFYNARLEEWGHDNDMEWQFHEKAAKTKRSWYEWISHDIPLKSDQKKFISEGLYCRNQLCYIKAFDLHNVHDMHKYAGYMKKYYCAEDDSGWTVATLDYLWRNKIPLHDYRDYSRMCRTLGRKPDKPKDFVYWHDQISAAYELKKNEAIDKQIQERSRALTGYEKKDTVIKSIESYSELIDISKQLHNCIRSYAERYAKGETDLYCMQVNGKVIGAIEIRQKKLMQARADHNGKLPTKHQKTVNRWCIQQGVRI